MTIQLFDLAGKEDNRRFSPYCWRVRMALAHKGLDVKTIPWRFTEKEAIAPSEQKLVPVIIDDGNYINDSWDIACYLDQKYPDRPLLFQDDAAKALSLFVKNWVERSLFPHFIRILALDIHDHLHEKDKAYFRETREARFKCTLEKFTKDWAQSIKNLQEALAPARATLEAQPYLCGEKPAYADYILFGAFQWARHVSPKQLLAPDDTIYKWRERLLDMFDDVKREETIAYNENFENGNF